MTWQLYHGDCLEILPSLPYESIDLILTDPPYGIDYQSARRIDKAKWKPKIANDTKPFTAWTNDAFRIMKDTGALLCFCRWDVQEVFKEAIEKSGFHIKSQIVWDREIHGMGDLKTQFAPQHDVIWFATKGKFTFPGIRPPSVLRFKRIDAEKLIHPNEKPTDLMKYLISVTTKRGDVVADFFAGSGVVLEAAESLDRKSIGIELSEGYCDLIRHRMANMQPSLFGGDAT